MDKENIMIDDLFKQASMLQIEDSGFTERVMQSLPDREAERARRLSRLWTIFCLVVGAVLFFVLGGWEVVKGMMLGGLSMLLSTTEVFLTTAPTAEIPVNPWAVVVLLAFVLVFLPYQTARKLSSVL